MNEKDKAFEILRECFKNGGKLLVCGNGGSAADCEHIVGELMKGMSSSTKPLMRALPAISLCSQMGLMTAIVNDMGAEWMFAQQVYGYGKPGDVLLGITTSGRSTNVLRAFVVARERGMKTIAITGPRTRDLEPLCDVVISAPGFIASGIQERHQQIYHELCNRLEEEFYT